MIYVDLPLLTELKENILGSQTLRDSMMWHPQWKMKDTISSSFTNENVTSNMDEKSTCNKYLTDRTDGLLV